MNDNRRLTANEIRLADKGKKQIILLAACFLSFNIFEFVINFHWRIGAGHIISLCLSFIIAVLLCFGKKNVKMLVNCSATFVVIRTVLDLMSKGQEMSRFNFIMLFALVAAYIAVYIILTASRPINFYFENRKQQNM